MLLSFFAVNGHLYLIDLLYKSVEKMPIGEIIINPKIGWILLEFFVQAFLLGVIVSLPILASGLLSDVSFGLLMKTVPQLNAFAIGIPVKMILGFMVLAAFMGVFIPFCNYVFGQMFAGMDRAFALLTG
jgi:flagellar biosynthetic protein FliR